MWGHLYGSQRLGGPRDRGWRGAGLSVRLHLESWARGGGTAQRHDDCLTAPRPTTPESGGGGHTSAGPACARGWGPGADAPRGCGIGPRATRELPPRPRAPAAVARSRRRGVSCTEGTLATHENPEWIAKQLGHTSTQMLFQRYAKFIPNVTHRDGTAFLKAYQGWFAGEGSR